MRWYGEHGKPQSTSSASRKQALSRPAVSLWLTHSLLPLQELDIMAAPLRPQGIWVMGKINHLCKIAHYSTEREFA
ncbi:hypothetical protein AOLI_G00151780 [Acnodon oligacanthus]